MQGLHAIPRTTLKLCGLVPQEIASYITQAEYSVVCTEVQQSDSEATLMSCGVEVGVCIISGLFCVFCAHPWIEEMIANGNLPRRLQAMNSSLYGGLPILSMCGNSVNFSTSLLAENGRAPLAVNMVTPVGMQMHGYEAKQGVTMALPPAQMAGQSGNGHYYGAQGQYAAVPVVQAVAVDGRV